MLDIICTRKEKFISFFEIYKTGSIIFKSENFSYTGEKVDIRFIVSANEKVPSVCK